jgi:YidC/Oxa1 family membrane protein insertase
MDRDTLLRLLLIGGVVFLAITFLPKLFGNGGTEAQPLRFESTMVASAPGAERLCDIWGDRFRAQLSTRGGVLKHFVLTTAKYTKGQKPYDLSTTPEQPFRPLLGLHFRNEAAESKELAWQVDYDLLDFELARATGSECEFRYRDGAVEVTQLVRRTERPYELEVSAELKNLASGPRQHALAINTAAWRTHEEVQGRMFTVSPFVTHVECIGRDAHAMRLREGDFEPGKFSGERFAANPLNLGDWFQALGQPDVAAVSNAYFSHALIPLEGQQAPACQLQIEERWDSSKFSSKKGDPSAGAMYRARLVYPKQVLEPGQAARYKALAYVGPKEREVLSAAAGGRHHTDELIDLGFFSVIAKVLVAFLLKVYGIFPNWGLAIIVLTVTARTLLFPLSLPSIKSMIKMRELKPELDELNKKYKDDPQARGLAQMELWRKHKVNPLKGCLPQLASMPVWFALYTTLQTAVELYNIPFLWFPDLSLPDPYFVLPFIIGGTAFVQQKLMPMQGGDPAQQKMMLYFMPSMFTVFMLFLPSGLGVYMFTNSLLGIVQQQAVEWHVRRTKGGGPAGGPAGISVEVKGEQASAVKRSKKSQQAPRPLLSKGRAS